MPNLRVKQAAAYVGLSKSYLDKARCYGTGPVYVKLGTTVIYRTEDLDAWVAGNRQPGNDNAERARAAA
ncbi:helix-turn-helix transcriptional regulator [Tianweitania sediminis]|uniref:DNA-binding protein n=1 Tax=Tianweitania sediminis TaxID=1502156 RepID=A0A8J7R6V8_9HYPH|nr:DNA-binding protein [Tianweitania sediminis]MBP0439092.1 DNA-binding protein [Tianweitania sediminis]